MIAGNNNHRHPLIESKKSGNGHRNNNHRHPLIESKKSGNGHRYSYFLDQIMVGLLGLDELAEVFQCQLHTFSGKRQKHPASTYYVCSDFRLSI